MSEFLAKFRSKPPTSAVTLVPPKAGSKWQLTLSEAPEMFLISRVQGETVSMYRETEIQSQTVPRVISIQWTESVAKNAVQQPEVVYQDYDLALVYHPNYPKAEYGFYFDGDFYLIFCNMYVPLSQVLASRRFTLTEKWVQYLNGCRIIHRSARCAQHWIVETSQCTKTSCFVQLQTSGFFIFPNFLKVSGHPGWYLKQQKVESVVIDWDMIRTTRTFYRQQMTRAIAQVGTQILYQWQDREQMNPLREFKCDCEPLFPTTAVVYWLNQQMKRRNLSWIVWKKVSDHSVGLDYLLCDDDDDDARPDQEEGGMGVV